MKYKENFFQKCPIESVLAIIQGKWKVGILLLLYDFKSLRTHQIRDNLGNVSQKILTLQLRSLEDDGIICRKVHPSVPPKVEYSLTEKGKKLIELLGEIQKWVDSINV